MLVFTHSAAQRKIASLQMVLLWCQRTFVTVHNVALKQKLPKLRLFHLEHFAQLAKAQRLMHINKAIKEFCLWGRQRQLLFRRTALLKLFCPGTCRFRRISEIGQMGEFFPLLPAVQQFGGKARERRATASSESRLFS